MTVGAVSEIDHAAPAGPVSEMPLEGDGALPLGKVPMPQWPICPLVPVPDSVATKTPLSVGVVLGSNCLQSPPLARLMVAIG